MSSSRFATNSADKKLRPVIFAPGRARLATRPSLTGSSATTNANGSGGGCRLDSKDRGCAGRGDQGDVATNQLPCECRQPVDLILRPAVFDRHIHAFDIAAVLQTLPKCAQTIRIPVGRRD